MGLESARSPILGAPSAAAAGLIAMAVAAAVFAAEASVAAGASPRVERLVRLSGPSPFPDGCGRETAQPGYEFEPHLAVDPRRPDRLVASWQQDRHTNRAALAHAVRRSVDGGRTWDTVEIPGVTTCPPPGSRGVTDPWASFGAGRAAYAAAARMGEEGGPEDILVAASDDDGRTFGDPVALVDSGDYLMHYPDKPVMAADPRVTGRAYAMWVKVANTPLGGAPFASSLQFSSTADGGLTWSPETAAYLQPRQPSDPHLNELLALPGGTLLAFFFEYGAGDLEAEQSGGPAAGDSTVRAIRSEDHGRTWSAPITVAEHGNLDGVDPDGTRYLGGVLPAAALGPDGTVYAAWADMENPRSGAVRIAASEDQGRTWSETRAVTDGPHHPSTPAIAVARNGAVGVLYTDFKADRTGDDRTDLAAWLAVSRDRGRSWSEAMLGEPFDLRMGPRFGRVGDYHAIVPLRRGFGAVFAATPPVAEDGLTDVFFARVRLGRPRLALAVRPRRVRAGRRAVFRFRVTQRGRSGREPVAGAKIRFAGGVARTDRRGRARMRRELTRVGRYPVRASKRGFKPARSVVRVLPVGVG